MNRQEAVNDLLPVAVDLRFATVLRFRGCARWWRHYLRRVLGQRGTRPQGSGPQAGGPCLRRQQGAMPSRSSKTTLLELREPAASLALRLRARGHAALPAAGGARGLPNAFCHRDYAIGGGSVGVAIYDDRLEVTSSGSLHFGLTPDALFGPHESLPWNPLIAGVFYRRGIIESWGRGTIRMAELAVSAGLPRPEIEDAAGCVTVRFRPTRYVPPRRVGRDLTERQQAILSVLHEAAGRLSLREIHLGGPATERQVREDLSTLRTLGLAIPSGHGRGARWKHA